MRWILGQDYSHWSGQPICHPPVIHSLISSFREWTDQTWLTTKGVQSGLQSAVRRQRYSLFGANAIDIDGKSTASLLVDEVHDFVSTTLFLMRNSQIIHPFYVFQIASIVLWSLDDYYYYAFCIAVISVLSVATTLVETKKVCVFSAAFSFR